MLSRIDPGTRRAIGSESSNDPVPPPRGSEAFGEDAGGDCGGAESNGRRTLGLLSASQEPGFVDLSPWAVAEWLC